MDRCNRLKILLLGFCIFWIYNFINIYYLKMNFNTVVDLMLSCFALSVIIIYLYMFFKLRSYDKVKGVIGSWGVQFYKVII